MKLKLVIACIAGVAVFNTQNVRAQTTPVAGTIPASALKAAEEMLIASGGKAQFDKSAQIGIEQMLSNVPADKRTKVLDIMKTFMGKYVTWDSLKGDICQIYAREFTEPELKQLTAFYQSPIGKKLQEKTPLIIQTSMAISQKAVADHQAELQQQMMEAFK